MNERIRELAYKAGLHNHLWLDISDSDDVLDTVKFAELIVKECINQALEEKVSEEEIDREDDIEDRCYLRGNNGGIVDAVIRIRQHFGIEP